MKISNAHSSFITRIGCWTLCSTKMRVVAAALAFLLSKTAAAASVAPYAPARISYADLAKISQEGAFSSESDSATSKALIRALEDVGMISITEIPSFGSCKMKTLNSLRDCIFDSSAALEHTFPDGTVRRTIASHCLAGKAHKIQHQHGDLLKSDTAAAAACDAFDETSETFRQMVANVTDTLAMSLEAGLNIPTDKDLVFSDSRSFSLVVSFFVQ
jgi:hypothetical protein